MAKKQSKGPKRPSSPPPRATEAQGALAVNVAAARTVSAPSLWAGAPPLPGTSTERLLAFALASSGSSTPASTQVASAPAPKAPIPAAQAQTPSPQPGPSAAVLTPGAGSSAAAAPTAEAKPEPAPARRAEPSHTEISRRAYELYRSRGSRPGSPEADWLEAERQLRQG